MIQGFEFYLRRQDDILSIQNYNNDALVGTSAVDQVHCRLPQLPKTALDQPPGPSALNHTKLPLGQNSGQGYQYNAANGVIDLEGAHLDTPIQVSQDIGRISTSNECL